MVQNITQRTGAALLDRIGPSILIMHSQAGPLRFLIADARPSLVKALISLEPQGPPFEDRVITNSTAITRPYGLTNIPLPTTHPSPRPRTEAPATPTSTSRTRPCLRPARTLANACSNPPRRHGR